MTPKPRSGKVDAGNTLAFDAEALKGVLTWASGGFVLLAGIATFFGIKEGALDRLVRASPGEAMVVFFLVGLGVVLAVLAPALDVDRKGPLLLVVLAAVPVVWLSLGTGKTIPDLDLGWLDTLLPGIAFVVVVAAGVWLALDGTEVRWPVAAAVLAVLSVSGGLFAAARVVVADKLDLAGATYSTDVSEADGTRTLTVSASGSDVVKPIRVVIEGLRPAAGGPDGHAVLAEELLTPDRTDSISADIALPVVDVGWTELRVVTCSGEPLVGAGTGEVKTCRDPEVVARFPLTRRSSVLGASVAADAKKAVTFDVTATDVPIGGRVTAQVLVGTRVVTSMERGADPEGAVSWTGSLGVRSGVITVLGSTCPPEGDCSEAAELARLEVP
jgi:hypothetical protein